MPRDPALPPTPLRFTCRYVALFRWWFLGAFVFETGAASAGISVPYALGHLTRTIASAVRGPATTAALRAPALLFVGLSLADLFFSRAAGNCQFLTSPRLRQRVTNDLYAHLQRHGQRYFDESFAGALAHRISETSAGVTQSLWTVVNDFWPIAMTLTVAVTLLSRSSTTLALFVGSWSVVFVTVSETT